MTEKEKEVELEEEEEEYDEEQSKIIKENFEKMFEQGRKIHEENEKKWNKSFFELDRMERNDLMLVGVKLREEGLQGFIPNLPIELQNDVIRYCTANKVDGEKFKIEAIKYYLQVMNLKKE